MGEKLLLIHREQWHILSANLTIPSNRSAFLWINKSFLVAQVFHSCEFN